MVETLQTSIFTCSSFRVNLFQKTVPFSLLSWKGTLQMFTFWKYLIARATCHHQKVSKFGKLVFLSRKIISLIIKLNKLARDSLSCTVSLLFSLQTIERSYHLKYTLPAHVNCYVTHQAEGEGVGADFSRLQHEGTPILSSGDLIHPRRHTTVWWMDR